MVDFTVLSSLGDLSFFDKRTVALHVEKLDVSPCVAEMDWNMSVKTRSEFEASNYNLLQFLTIYSIFIVFNVLQYIHMHLF